MKIKAGPLSGWRTFLLLDQIRSTTNNQQQQHQQQMPQGTT